MGCLSGTHKTKNILDNGSIYFAFFILYCCLSFSVVITLVTPITISIKAAHTSCRHKNASKQLFTKAYRSLKIEKWCISTKDVYVFMFLEAAVCMRVAIFWDVSYFVLKIWTRNKGINPQLIMSIYSKLENTKYAHYTLAWSQVLLKWKLCPDDGIRWNVRGQQNCKVILGTMSIHSMVICNTVISLCS